METGIDRLCKYPFAAHRFRNVPCLVDVRHLSGGRNASLDHLADD
jgi:hypothetical protein